MKVRLNVQKVYALIVTYMLSFLALLNLGNAILNRIGLYTVYDTVLLYGMLVGLIGLGVLVSVMDGGTLRLDDIALIGFLAVSFILSGLLHPNNRKYLFTSWMDYAKNPVYIVFLYSLPGFYFARRLRGYEHFMRFMTFFSYAVVAMSVIVYFAAVDSAAMQYMTFSYNMLTQLLFLCLYPPKKRGLLHYGIVVAGLFVFYVGGSRGAMLSFTLTVALSFFIRNWGKKKTVLAGTVVVVVVIAFAVFKNSLFMLIANVLERLSIDSRTFGLLLEGELLNDIHRMRLYRKTIGNISILGSCVMSDRILLNGAYPHNMFLELVYQFGWLMGSVLILLICFCLVVALANKTRGEWALVILLLPCGFMKLMLTGSYLHQEPAFYVLLGLCINSILRGRKNADSNDQYCLGSWKHR